MKHIYFLLFCLTFSIQAQYKPAPNMALYVQITQDSLKTKRVLQDPWLGKDKAKHLIASGLITLSSQYLLVNGLKKSEKKALPFSVANAAFWGLMKEIYDKKKSPSRYFSKRDLVADGLGVALAAILIKAATK